MTISSTSRRAVIAAMAGALCAVGLPALAQSAPDRPLRVIIPLSPGSTVDTMGRAMSNEMAKVFGHPVVVENLAGAGGVTGTAQLVKAPKDGMTVGLISSNHVINPSIYKSVPFDSLKDITPITVIGTVPLVLVVNPSVAAKTTAELVALMKVKKGELNVGSAGNGSVLHLAAELFGSEAGVDIQHIPYKGTGPMMNDLLGGQVQLGFLSVTAAVSQIKAGKLRAIGVSTKQRSAILPDVPTLAESGLPNYSFDAWIAAIGPAGMAPAQVQKYYNDFKAVVKHPDVQSAFAAQGVATVLNTPEQATAFFKTELDKHAVLVKKSGASLD